MERLGDVTSLLANILETVRDNLAAQSIAAERMMQIVGNALGETPRAPNERQRKADGHCSGFKQTRAYQETHTRFKRLGIQCIGIIDLRCLAHMIFKQADIPDSPPSKRRSDIFLKLDEHWETVGAQMTTAIERWASRHMVDENEPK
jgi:hypothetical protein